MTRRKFLVALALVALSLGGAGVVLYLVVGYVPDVYARAAAPSDEVRAQRSKEFLAEFSDLYNDAAGAEQNWSVQFTDEQVNSYLDEGFVKQGLASRVLTDGVSRPHVVFEPGKAHLAFRYGGAWNTVISVDLRVWLAKDEPNAIALELEGLRAGALPISGQWLQQELAKAVRESGGSLDMSWYRLNGHPVALLRFQADQAHPTLLLQDVHLDQGSLTIRGRSPEAAMHAFLMQFPGGLPKPVVTD
jgi:hypothetical protein